MIVARSSLLGKRLEGCVVRQADDRMITLRSPPLSAVRFADKSTLCDKPPCLIILDAWLSVWCRIRGPLRIKMPGEPGSASLLAVPNVGKKAQPAKPLQRLLLRGTHWPMTLKISKSSSRTSRHRRLIDWTLSRLASFQLGRRHEISARAGELVSES